MRLVVPRYPVVVEDLRALDLDAVREPRRVRSTICLENGAFHPHLRQGTNGLGRPRTRAVDCPHGRLERVFRIAQFSDLHCGGPYFEASLLERAIGEINELEPGHRRLLGRSDDVRLPARVPDGARVPRPDRLRRARRRSRKSRLAQRRVRPLRGDVRRAELGPSQGRDRRSSPSTRASPTSTTARSAGGATAGSRSSSRTSRPT